MGVPSRSVDEGATGGGGCRRTVARRRSDDAEARTPFPADAAAAVTAAGELAPPCADPSLTGASCGASRGRSVGNRRTGAPGGASIGVRPIGDRVSRAEAMPHGGVSDSGSRCPAMGVRGAVRKRPTGVAKARSDAGDAGTEKRTEPGDLPRCRTDVADPTGCRDHTGPSTDGPVPEGAGLPRRAPGEALCNPAGMPRPAVPAARRPTRSATTPPTPPTAGFLVAPSVTCRDGAFPEPPVTCRDGAVPVSPGLFRLDERNTAGAGR